MKLVLHPKTSIQLENLRVNAPHAVLITGEKGIGKSAVATSIAENYFSKTADYTQHVKTYSAKDKEFGVETVNQIQKFLKTKHSHTEIVSKLVIIDDAHELSIQAQNMILKTLEEPSLGSMLILCVPNKNMVIKTIVSRCQVINLIPPSKNDVLDFFSGQKIQLGELESAYKMSGGLPGLMHAILCKENHPLITATDVAKQLLTSSHFDKLCLIETLAKDKDLLTNVTFMLQQISHSAILSAESKQALKWSKVLDASYRADEMLSKNVSSKLVCDKLMLSL